MPTAIAPLITDPIFDGVNDPTLVWNEATSEWWCIFARRRSNVRLSAQTIGPVHGTPLGAATSTDHGASWLYRGALNLPIEPGHNTFWGPTAFTVDGVHHLFTTFIRGVPNDPAWDSHGRPSPWARQVHHLSSSDLWTWKHHGRVDLGTDHGHDAAVLQMRDGTWSLWFKDEAIGGAICRVDSTDLETWSSPLTVLPEWHESPIVFQLGGYYWLVAESRSGLTSYRSEHASIWEATGPFVAEVGSRTADVGPVRSPDVVPLPDGTAYLVYYTQTGVDSYGNPAPTSSQTSTAQVALLSVVAGHLHCDRDAEFDFRLPDQLAHV
ncbi:MAG: glycosyl hydrolase [Actinomycetota bacterium]|nr:glycosyl hydrolase [Actinomycetota bacterium]